MHPWQWTCKSELSWFTASVKAECRHLLFRSWPGIDFPIASGLDINRIGWKRKLPNLESLYTINIRYVLSLSFSFVLLSLDSVSMTLGERERHVILMTEKFSKALRFRDQRLHDDLVPYFQHLQNSLNDNGKGRKASSLLFHSKSFLNQNSPIWNKVRTQQTSCSHSLKLLTAPNFFQRFLAFTD